MTRPQVSIHNAATGETTVRDMTDEELAQHEVDMAAAAQAESEEEAAKAARVAARESALAKLAALGLTEAEAAAIIK